MTLSTVKERVKTSKLLYSAYYYIGTGFVNLLKLFVKPDEKTILFVSFGGRHFSDSPKVIFDQMINDERFNEYDIVWAFVNPEKFNLPERAKKIKIDSLEYYLTALKARCWITNVQIERALSFTGKHTFYFHTTHGVLVKKSGLDSDPKKTFMAKKPSKYDISLASCEFEKEIEQRIYALPPEKIKVLGFPIDDVLLSFTNEDVNNIRKKLNIPSDKKIITYAPTFRDDELYNTNVSLNIDMWEKNLGDRYCLIYRGHPSVDNINAPKESNFFFNFSKYESLIDILAISDILISDYSGVLFEYCIQHKPLYCWTYDYEQFDETRGLYFDIRKELPGGSISEEDLVKLLKNPDQSYAKDCCINLQKKYRTTYENSTQRSLDCIYNNIKHNINE